MKTKKITQTLIPIMVLCTIITVISSDFNLLLNNKVLIIISAGCTVPLYYVGFKVGKYVKKLTSNI